MIGVAGLCLANNQPPIRFVFGTFGGAPTQMCGGSRGHWMDKGRQLEPQSCSQPVAAFWPEGESPPLLLPSPLRDDSECPRWPSQSPERSPNQVCKAFGKYPEGWGL